MDARATVNEGAGTEATASGPAGRALKALRGLGPGRILAVGGVVLALLALLTVVVERAADPGYTLLFSGLELPDSQRLVERLDGMGVPYRLSPGGEAIMVPADRALRLRMALAEEGQPLGSTLGYELFDRSSVLGASDFLANVTLRRAIEGELARSIGTLRHVRSARVHIVVPERQPFAREATKPSASIVLALDTAATLAPHQVDGIRHLVAAAVPGLAPEAVTLVDGAGNLLGGGDPTTGDLSGADDYRAGYEGRLKAKIVQLLERSVGAGKVDAEVSADLDFDALTTTDETYDPNGQVVRSTQTSEERNEQAERQANDTVSVANNLPTERAAQPAAGPSSNERSNRNDETINYGLMEQTHLP